MNQPRILVGIQEAAATTWSTCTVINADGTFCESTVPTGAPVSSCKRHLVAAFLYCENLIAEQQAENQYGRSALAVAEDRIAEMRQNPVVYYARFGDLIKIGTTNDLRTRMIAIKPDCVLASEPGSYEVEHARHRQFARSKAPAGREMFYETEDLTAHIRNLQMTAADALRGRTKNVFFTDEELASREAQ